MKRLILLSAYFSLLSASPAEDLFYEKYSLDPCVKSTRQWHIFFANKAELKKRGLSKMSSKEKILLEAYICAHSADSDKPTCSTKEK